MANLTQNEKDLLAVVKYYNDNEKKIDRLIYKLVEGLSIEQAAVLTGYNEETVKAIHFEVKENAKLRAKRNAKSVTEKLQAENLPAMVDEEFVKQGHTRLAIHLDANSNSITRTAYDIAKAIEKDPVEPGTPLWNTDELSRRFGGNPGNLPKIRKVLMDHNWIAMVEEGRPRKGYVVK